MADIRDALAEALHDEVCTYNDPEPVLCGIDHAGEAGRLLAREPLAGLVAALESVTARRDCGHGRIDVIHIAPSHFIGAACPSCSDAAYADEMQRREPCPICAALEGRTDA